MLRAKHGLLLINNLVLIVMFISPRFFYFDLFLINKEYTITNAALLYFTIFNYIFTIKKKYKIYIYIYIYIYI